jgi:hypothetical protein
MPHNARLAIIWEYSRKRLKIFTETSYKMTVDDMQRIKNEYFPNEKNTSLKEFLEHGKYSKEINIIINSPEERKRLFPKTYYED